MISRAFPLSTKINIKLLDTDMFEQPIGTAEDGDKLYSCATWEQFSSEVLPLSDEFLCSALNISAFKEFEHLLSKYPRLKVINAADNMIPHGLTTKKMYYKKFIFEMKRLRGISKLFSCYEQYLKKEETKYAYSIMELFVYDDDVRTLVSEETSESLRLYLETEDLKIESGTPLKYSAALSAISSAVNDLKCWIETEINESLEGSVCLEDNEIHCAFTNADSAMRMYLSLLLINGFELRQCTHSNCHSLFLLNPKHPQTMCDRHMSARRRARTNYSEKKKAMKQNVRTHKKPKE